MPQWIIEILYRVTVCLCLITGMMLLGTAWFLLWYHEWRVAWWFIDMGSNLGDWVLDKLFRCKGGTDER